jgi:hypothetical protein
MIWEFPFVTCHSTGKKIANNSRKIDFEWKSRFKEKISFSNFSVYSNEFTGKKLWENLLKIFLIFRLCRLGKALKYNWEKGSRWIFNSLWQSKNMEYKIKLWALCIVFEFQEIFTESYGNFGTFFLRYENCKNWDKFIN